ncbi:MAG: alanine racemase [Brevinema sp.]
MDFRVTRVEVNISQFQKNLLFFRNLIGQDKKLCLVVKANAYGHGLVPMAYHAQNFVDILAVATVNEGVRLREAGILLPILVLSTHLQSDIPIICHHRLTPLISHELFLEQYNHWSKYYGITLSLHIKVDTGMGRVGIRPEKTESLICKVKEYKNLFLEGICTHFAMADCGEAGQEFTQNQINIFQNLLNQLAQKNVVIPVVHAANSSGISYYPKSHFSLVRLGIGAYGYSEFSEVQPIMEFKTKITIIKTIPKGHIVSYGGAWTAPEDTKIGILPVGYADGYMRCLSNKSFVLVGGHQCPVLGMICMDQMVIALPEHVFLEQDVLLYGNDPRLTAVELALLAQTIPYEILTAVSERVPRIYY